MNTLAIIGGGASGLAAAIQAGMSARKGGTALNICVYEADDRVGKSILRSGNGRCNFSNSDIQARLYRNPGFVGEVMRALYFAGGHTGAAAVRSLKTQADLDFFETWGLTWHEESEGRLYPFTNKATTVLNILRSACADFGVEERCGCMVERVEPPRKEGAPFTLCLKGGELQRAQAVIVACGGNVAQKLLPPGLPFVPLRPVLGPLEGRLLVSEGEKKGAGKKKQGTNHLLNLNNVRIDCSARLLRGKDQKEVAREKGELLFRKYGVSGIMVFNLSRFAEPGDILELDLMSGVPLPQVENWLFSKRKRIASAYDRQLTWEDMLRGMVLPPVAALVADLAEVTLGRVFDKSQVPVLARALKGVVLLVDGVHDQEGQCQVHRGGVAVESVDPESCQVQGCPGLYVVGEALDVDAPCGGYNLHWAWTSGMLAGMNAVAYLG